jgi:hypothetical protein
MEAKNIELKLELSYAPPRSAPIAAAHAVHGEVTP